MEGVGYPELLERFDRFVDAIWRGCHDRSVDERLTGIELCKRVYSANVHPEYDDGVRKMLERLPWGQTILGGPYHWFIDMNRSRQMGIALDEFELHVVGLPYPPEVQVGPLDAALRYLRHKHAFWRRVASDADGRSSGGRLDDGRGQVDLDVAAHLLRRTYAVLEDPCFGLDLTDLSQSAPWRWVLELDPVDYSATAHVDQIARAVAAAEADLAAAQDMRPSVVEPPGAEL